MGIERTVETDDEVGVSVVSSSCVNRIHGPIYCAYFAGIVPDEDV